MSLKTYLRRDDAKATDWELFDWKPGMALRASPWAGNDLHNQDYHPYLMGQEVVFPQANRWSFGCGSVYNWIDNVPYGIVCTDTARPETYFLRATNKHCAGDHLPPRDILVDGYWWYHIKDLVITESKVGDDDGKTMCHCWHGATFTVDSEPHDVCRVVQQMREQGARQYMGEWKIAPFAITISHADARKHKWLSRAQCKQIEAALKPIFNEASETCLFEP